MITLTSDLNKHFEWLAVCNCPNGLQRIYQTNRLITLSVILPLSGDLCIGLQCSATGL